MLDRTNEGLSHSKAFIDWYQAIYRKNMLDNKQNKQIISPTQYR